MDNPGVFTLAALQLGTAQQQTLLTPIINLGGMAVAALTFNFQYGTGTGTATAIVATTFDGGKTWWHITRFDFATTPLRKYKTHVLSSISATYADLTSNDTHNEGLLGDQLAMFLTTTGTYSSTVLDVRASVG